MTPKEQFLETPHVEAHKKLVQTEAFREALNYALLEFSGNLDFSQVELAVSGAQIRGAQEFCKVLKNLASIEAVPHGTQPKSINYDAYDRPRRTA